MTLTVEVVRQDAEDHLWHGITLAQFERENHRLYLQSEGDPRRVDLCVGDSIIVTVEEP